VLCVVGKRSRWSLAVAGGDDDGSSVAGSSLLQAMHVLKSIQGDVRLPC